MNLHKYNQKRHFDSTNEPKGGMKKNDGKLIFVVQKHAASHLHYDFRLEMEGVLKSWAIPKGPSMNPQQKRLAIRVEDHPYNYKDFEGVIPDGNYGAGRVIVWDCGTYDLTDKAFEGDIETQLKSDLETGNLHLNLNGKKLKGAFALVKFKSKQDSTWLLIKKKDQYATKEDVLNKKQSVLSNTIL